MIINHYTTAGIMCSRHNRHGFFREIYPQPEQFFINHREMLANKIGGLMANIKEHTICAEAFHFMVNGAGDNIARGQFAALIKIGHKTRAIRALEISAFAAQCFR